MFRQLWVEVDQQKGQTKEWGFIEKEGEAKSWNWRTKEGYKDCVRCT